MKIARQTGDNCVARAFSTMRAVLEYDTPLPEGYTPNGPVQDTDMCATAVRFFPDRPVLVWCLEKFVDGVENIQWMGDFCDDVLDDYIVAFTYYTNKRHRVAHMVVGHPQMYGRAHF